MGRPDKYDDMAEALYIRLWHQPQEEASEIADAVRAAAAEAREAALTEAVTEIDRVFPFAKQANGVAWRIRCLIAERLRALKQPKETP